MASKYKTGSKIRTVTLEKSSFDILNKEKWAYYWR
jgi:hypothetical protein